MKILYLVALTVLFCSVVLAQEDSLKVKQITLKDGSELVGRIISDDAVRIQFKTNSGVEMTRERGLIREIKDLEMEEHEGKLRRVDPNQTRLLFSPTARPLKQGNGYFSVYEIFFPMVIDHFDHVISVSNHEIHREILKYRLVIFKKVIKLCVCIFGGLVRSDLSVRHLY